jgi:hypothetical protein
LAQCPKKKNGFLKAIFLRIQLFYGTIHPPLFLNVVQQKCLFSYGGVPKIDHIGLKNNEVAMISGDIISYN